MKLENIIAIYEKNLAAAGVVPAGAFPVAPADSLSPAEFVDCLIARAAENDARAFHNFSRNIARARYSVTQLRVWVQQGYPSVIEDIRRHALIAAKAQECDLLRSLLSYVGVEADADPVGGTFFSLPQLWIKFGISLGLAREQIVSAEQDRTLFQHEQETTARTNREEIPVSHFVNAILNPSFAACIGRRLHAQLGYARDSFDYFWAIAGNRWGEDAGRQILERWCETGEGRQSVWRRYAQECIAERAGQRLSLMQAVVESASRG